MNWLLTTFLSACACAAAIGSSNARPRAAVDDYGNHAMMPGPSQHATGFVPGIGAGAGGADGGMLRGGNPCAANWVPLGPYGGDVDDVAMSPVDANIVLAGTAPGGSGGGTLYRSTDGGASWVEVAALSGTTVYDIEFTPSGVVYLGTYQGVWKSTDGGVSWTQLNLGIGEYDGTHEVAIDPSDENTVYAGVADHLGNQDQNVLRSTDGGNTWSDITPPLATPVTCRGIAINPNDSDNIFAAFGGWAGGGQVWVSTDGAASWTNRSAGLPNNPMNDIVHDGMRALLCGGQAFGSQFVGLYVTTDNGQTWTALHDETWPSLVINDCEVDPADANNIYLASIVGVYHSTDGGGTWSFGIGGSSSFSVNSVRIDPGHSSGIFLGAACVAVWRSTDGGESFTQSSVGIGQSNLYAIAANPYNTDELAIAFQGWNTGGVYTSLDGGVTWTLEPVPPTRYNRVHFAPDGLLYAISDGPSTIAPEGLYRRNAEGTWTSLGPDQGSLFESEMHNMCFSQNDPNLIMLCGADFGVVGREPTIWRSTDAGETWTKTYEAPEGSSGDVKGLKIVEDGTDSVMLACFYGWEPRDGGALRSTDGGVTWYESSSGLPAQAQGQALQVFPDDPEAFYFAAGDYGPGYGGLWVTADAGLSWTNTGYFGYVVWGVVCNPTDARMVYVVKHDAPLVVASYDSGASFEPFSAGLELAYFGRELHYALDDAARLLIATNTGAYAADLRFGPMNDCNTNDRPDECDIAEGTSGDVNGNGIPDECECPQPGCEADLDGNCVVDLSDLAELLSNYGDPGRIVDGDVAPPHDGLVDLTDLAFLLSQYGNECN